MRRRSVWRLSESLPDHLQPWVPVRLPGEGLREEGSHRCGELRLVPPWSLYERVGVHCWLPRKGLREEGAHQVDLARPRGPRHRLVRHWHRH